MRIGDKVRMLHDDIEGVVTKIIDQYQVEIEDTFGFDFPVLTKDLIIVDAIEDEFFNKGEDELPVFVDEKPEINKVQKGVYFAFVSEFKNYGLYIINNTDVNQFVSVYGYTKSEFNSLGAVLVSSKSKSRIAVYPMSEIETWKQLFIVSHGVQSSKNTPVTHQKLMVLKASKVMTAQEDIPFHTEKGYLKQIDMDDVAPVDISTLSSKMNESSSVVQSSVETLTKPGKEIDLHAEALGLDNDSSFVLAKQISVFQENIESAIAHAYSEITFIHGIGNGVLRAEIHKRMKEYEQVKFFEDAQKSKFGYGATKVVFK